MSEVKASGSELRRQLAEMLGFWHSEVLDTRPDGVPGGGSWDRMEPLVRELGRRRRYKVHRPGEFAKVLKQVDRDYPKLGLLATVAECYRRLTRFPPAPHLLLLQAAELPRFAGVAEQLRQVASCVEWNTVASDAPDPADLKRLVPALEAVLKPYRSDWYLRFRRELAKAEPLAVTENGLRDFLVPFEPLLGRLWLLELAAEQVRWTESAHAATSLAQRFVYAGWPEADTVLSRIFPGLIRHDYATPPPESPAGWKLRKRKQRGRERVKQARLLPPAPGPEPAGFH